MGEMPSFRRLIASTRNRLTRWPVCLRDMAHLALPDPPSRGGYEPLNHETGVFAEPWLAGLWSA
jgi:hypothetical protein